MTGKIAVRDGAEGYAARFSWLGLNDNYQIEVWGPLGQGRTQLEGDNISMLVRRGNKILAEGPPQAVMEANLGWSLPIHVLPAWIRGEPQDSIDFDDAARDDAGRYAQFNQAGWQVVLTGYKSRQGIDTPARVVAVSGARKVTVVVREYLQ